jgi:glycosyltransferase 2 family protein
VSSRASGLISLLGSRWLKLGLSVVLLAGLAYETDTADLRHALFAADPLWFWLALAGNIFSQVVSTVRWWMLTRPVGFGDPLGRLLAYYFSGMYLNLFAPSTVAGDIGRALFLAAGRRRALAFTTVIADRIIGLAALALIGALAIILLPDFPLPAYARWIAWAIPPLMVAGWLSLPKLVARLLPAGNRWRRLIETELAPYWNDLRLLAGTMVVSAAFHLIQIGTQVALARALGLPIAATFFLVFVPIVNILGMLPVSFSGIGVREAGYWYFLTPLGIDPEAAVALGLLGSLIVLVTGLSGAPFFLLLRHQET